MTANMSSVHSERLEGFVQNWTISASDVIASYQVGGADVGSRMLAVLEKTVARANRCDGVIAAGIRSSNSSSSFVSRNSECSSGSGLTGTRLNIIRNVESWRSGSVGGGSSSVGSGRDRSVRYPSGLCYGKLLSKASAEGVVSRLSQWPTFGSLVRLPVESFQPVSSLERFRLVASGEGAFHVAAGGDEGVGFLDEVASYSRRIKPPRGSMASALAGDFRYGQKPGGLRGSDRLGGGVRGDGLPSVASGGFPVAASSDAILPGGGDVGREDLGSLGYGGSPNLSRYPGYRFVFNSVGTARRFADLVGGFSLCDEVPSVSVNVVSESEDKGMTRACVDLTFSSVSAASGYRASPELQRRVASVSEVVSDMVEEHVIGAGELGFCSGVRESRVTFVFPSGAQAEGFASVASSAVSPLLVEGKCEVESSAVDGLVTYSGLTSSQVDSAVDASVVSSELKGGSAVVIKQVKCDEPRGWVSSSWYKCV